MTDLRTAAQQALDAMKCLVEAYEMQNMIRADINDAEYAITAIRAALEQPEQAPVAYWHKPNQEDEEFIHVQAVNGKCPDCVPLYTHPPRREWRGLTEEEINEATFHADERMNTHLEFARAIEAALKEKNHDQP
jgi:hypothetical protein